MTAPLDTNKDWNKDKANSNKQPQSRIVDTNNELRIKLADLTARWATGEQDHKEINNKILELFAHQQAIAELKGRIDALKNLKIGRTPSIQVKVINDSIATLNQQLSELNG